MSCTRKLSEAGRRSLRTIFWNVRSLGALGSRDLSWSSGLSKRCSLQVGPDGAASPVRRPERVHPPPCLKAEDKNLSYDLVKAPGNEGKESPNRLGAKDRVSKDRSR